MSEKKKTGIIGLIVLTLIILVPLVLSIIPVGQAGSQDLDGVFLEMPADSIQNCIMNTDSMRYHHWEILLGMRERVVRYGIREEHGLHSCRDCHTSRERFCNQCHNAVSMDPDCFGCHYYP